MPKLVIHPDDLPEIPKAAKQWLLAQAVNLVTRSPLGTVALAQYHIQHFFWDKFGVRLYSPTGRGGFIPVYDRDHPFWIQRFGAPLAASPTRTTPPPAASGRLRSGRLEMRSTAGLTNVLKDITGVTRKSVV